MANERHDDIKIVPGQKLEFFVETVGQLPEDQKIIAILTAFKNGALKTLAEADQENKNS